MQNCLNLSKKETAMAALTGQAMSRAGCITRKRDIWQGGYYQIAFFNFIIVFSFYLKGRFHLSFQN